MLTFRRRQRSILDADHGEAGVTGRQASVSGTRQKVIVFNRLTPLLALVARLLAWFGVSVIYIDPVGSVRRLEAMAQLAKVGIHQVDYTNLVGYDAFAHVKLLARYSRATMDALFPTIPWSGPRKLFRLLPIALAKFAP